jgi:hypothetical protein
LRTPGQGKLLPFSDKEYNLALRHPRKTPFCAELPSN